MAALLRASRHVCESAVLIGYALASCCGLATTRVVLRPRTLTLASRAGPNLAPGTVARPVKPSHCARRVQAELTSRLSSLDLEEPNEGRPRGGSREEILGGSGAFDFPGNLGRGSDFDDGPSEMWRERAKGFAGSCLVGGHWLQWRAGE